MRIVVCSDVHGNQYSFEKWMEILPEIQPDLLVFCGDVFGYYYYADEILTTLREKGFRCILGNHDKMLLDCLDGLLDYKVLSEKYGSVYLNPAVSQENIKYLRSLDTSITLQIGQIKLGFFHGTPDDHLNGRLYPDTEITNPEDYAPFDVVFLGHTHYKMIRSCNGTTIINPGSLGQQRDGTGCSFCIYDTETKSVQIETVPYSTKEILEDIQRFDRDKPMLKEVILRKSEKACSSSKGTQRGKESQ